MTEKNEKQDDAPIIYLLGYAVGALQKFYYHLESIEFIEGDSDYICALKNLLKKDIDFLDSKVEKFYDNKK